MHKQSHTLSVCPHLSLCPLSDQLDQLRVLPGTLPDLKYTYKDAFLKYISYHSVYTLHYNRMPTVQVLRCAPYSVEPPATLLSPCWGAD